MTPRDARILTLARSLAGPSPSFLDAIGALTTSVTRLVPAGRVFVLGATKDGPIVGSWISGVGIAVTPLSILAITAIYGLEILVAFIQAYVFTILTCVYLKDALHPAH